MIYRYRLRRGGLDWECVEIQTSEYELAARWRTVEVLTISDLRPLDETIELAKQKIATMTSHGFRKIESNV